MATINSLMSGSYNSSISRESREMMRDLKAQYKNQDINSNEYREKLNEVKDLQNNARMASAAMGVENANNVAGLFSYMNGNSGGGNSGSAVWGGGTFDTSAFIESKGTLSELQAMNSARIGIESRARSLVGEIGRDRARGLDVTDKQEALSNLTGNLNILNKNLSNSVDKALSDGKEDKKFTDIVGKIKSTLASPAATVNEQKEESSNTIADEPEQPSFAPPPVFEGSVSEQAVAASEEQEPDDMSIASQIANNAKSDYAESTNIMNENESEQIEQTPQNAVGMGVTPANA